MQACVVLWIFAILLVHVTQSYIWSRKKHLQEKEFARNNARRNSANSETGRDSGVDGPRGDTSDDRGGTTSTKTKKKQDKSGGNGANQDNECQAGPDCIELTVQAFHNGDWTNGVYVPLSRRECASSVDLAEIVCPRAGFDGVCSLFSAYGTRTISCTDAVADSSVFMVPAGRLFIIPTKEVGDRLEVDHLAMPAGKPIIMETLSVEPRIFKLKNFITDEEADQLIRNVLKLKSDSHKLKRATTMKLGSPDPVPDPYRTSDVAYDKNSNTAVGIKKRLFDLIGIYPFQESLTDGFQTARYNQSGAYYPHMDWVEPPAKGAPGHTVKRTISHATQHMMLKNGNTGNPNTLGELWDEHDYDSANGGTNRFVSLVLYLNTVEDGGETVFPQVDSVADQKKAAKLAKTKKRAKKGGETRKNEENETPVKEDSSKGRRGGYEVELPLMTSTTTTRAQKIASLQEADAYLAQKGTETEKSVPKASWERALLAECKSRLSVKAVKTEAVLFYSQHPNGTANFLTKHGGCPVLQGEKWVANLFIWNGPRNGYWIINKGTGEMERPKLGTVSASFESRDVQGAHLYWEDTAWEELAPGTPVKVNTFKGHTWHVRVNGKTVFTWHIDDDRPSQRFVISADDLMEIPKFPVHQDDPVYDEAGYLLQDEERARYLQEAYQYHEQQRQIRQEQDLNNGQLDDQAGAGAEAHVEADQEYEQEQQHDSDDGGQSDASFQEESTGMHSSNFQLPKHTLQQQQQQQSDSIEGVEMSRSDTDDGEDPLVASVALGPIFATDDHEHDWQHRYKQEKKRKYQKRKEPH